MNTGHGVWHGVWHLDSPLMVIVPVGITVSYELIRDQVICDQRLF